MTGTAYFLMFSTHRTLMRIGEWRRREAERRLTVLGAEDDENVA